MNIKHFALLSFVLVFASTSYQSNCLHATENVNNINPFYINKNSHLYRNINYNVDKFIKNASKKYGEEYWAKEAITSGNKYSSSIETLKKLLALAFNFTDDNDVDKIFNCIYSRILTALNDKKIDKSLSIKERLKSGDFNYVFGFMNTLTVYKTLYYKRNKNFLNNLVTIKTSQDYFDCIYRNLFSTDMDGYEKKIKSKLFEIFDGNEDALKKFLFHDWKCYLYQFSVITDVDEYRLAFHYPSTVMSTIIDLGLYCNQSVKIDCAKTVEKAKTIDNLVHSLLGKKTDRETCLDKIHSYIGKLEVSLKLGGVFRRFQEMIGVSGLKNFLPDFDEAPCDDVYYDYEYVNFIYNLSILARIQREDLQEAYRPDFQLRDFIISRCLTLIKGKYNKKLLNVKKSLTHNFDITDLLNIFIRCANTVVSIESSRKRQVRSGPSFVLDLENIIKQLLNFISENKLNNCHVYAFQNVFSAMENVGLDKTLSLLQDALRTNEPVQKDDFYSISKWVQTEASNIKGRKKM